MHRLRELHTRFEHSIPYAEHGSIRNVLAAYGESSTMLGMCVRAVERIVLPGVDKGTICIVAFGSVGRLDGVLQVSDYDTMFIYPGGKDQDTVDSLREAITALVTTNSAMPFDHREEIEARTFAFDDSPAYPVVSQTELLSAIQLPRTLQTLTEARVIAGRDAVDSMSKRLLAERYGFANDRHSIDLRLLRDDLARLKTAYCREVCGRLTQRPRSLGNRKILKLFALREFHYLATLFALAELAIIVQARADEQVLGLALTLLSSPSFLKVASFADPAGTLNRMFLSSRSLMAECSTSLARHAGRPAGTGIENPSGGPSHDRSVLSLIMDVLRPYDHLLEMVHDPDFLAEIEKFEPDVTTWMAHPVFKRILQHRGQLMSASSKLAEALLDVLGVLEQDVGCQAIDEAKITLDLIRTYELEMGAPVA